MTANSRPWDVRGARVTMLTTPVAALAPHMVEAGPRTTSICSMSLVCTAERSQKMTLKKSKKSGRPSTRASWLPVRNGLGPRVATLTSRADDWTTLAPGTSRMRSPTFCAGRVSMVLRPMTLMVVGVSSSRILVREAETTTVFSKAGCILKSISTVSPEARSTVSSMVTKPGMTAVSLRVPVDRFRARYRPSTVLSTERVAWPSMAMVTPGSGRSWSSVTRPVMLPVSCARLGVDDAGTEKNAENSSGNVSIHGFTTLQNRSRTPRS